MANEASGHFSSCIGICRTFHFTISFRCNDGKKKERDKTTQAVKATPHIKKGREKGEGREKAVRKAPK